MFFESREISMSDDSLVYITSDKETEEVVYSG